jgi:hypothetical protein
MSVDLWSIAPAALGVLALAAVLIWGLVRRRRRGRPLRTQVRRLATFDPGERVRGALAIIDLGLTRRSATVLLGHVNREEEAGVKLAIAEAVDRNDTRSRRRRVRRLQTWSAKELAANGRRALPTAEYERKKDPPTISWRAPAA